MCVSIKISDGVLIVMCFVVGIDGGTRTLFMLICQCPDDKIHEHALSLIANNLSKFEPPLEVGFLDGSGHTFFHFACGFNRFHAMSKLLHGKVDVEISPPPKVRTLLTF